MLLHFFHRNTVFPVARLFLFRARESRYQISARAGIIAGILPAAVGTTGLVVGMAYRPAKLEAELHIIRIFLDRLDAGLGLAREAAVHVAVTGGFQHPLGRVHRPQRIIAAA